ncbi:MAG TPA: imidazoleglycerol-phosphate dehydratase HisB [Chloroflexota bacterium]
MDEKREGSCSRKTGETEVSVRWVLDGSGECHADTGIGFLDHMVAQLAKHGLFDLDVSARGDLEVDEHHTIEDVAIALGRALDSGLGDRRGIVRMGDALVPLDESLARVSVDLGGRGYAVVVADISPLGAGGFRGDLVAHFFESFAREGRLTLHADLLRGENDHHKIEALFKATARALRAASRVDPMRADSLPTTKGVL